MNPLDALLRPLVGLVNRTIAESTPARELCRQLAGTTAVVRVRNTAMALSFRVRDDALDLEAGVAEDPDIAISGSLPALARLAFSHDEAAIRDGQVDLIGDAETAAAFQQLLAFARPDPEEELSRVVGDSAAHTAGRLARGLRQWAVDARSTLAGNLREYLQEESRDVPSRYETERFSRDVDTLRDDVDRLAARIDRLGDPH